MIHQLRVIFGDTDQMGVVYYANYLRYFESARADYWRQQGKSYKDIDALGVALPVIAAHCDYKRPAHYEDLLEIAVDVTEMRGATLRFEYTVALAGRVLATGYTRHAVVRIRDGRPTAIPAALRAAMPVVAATVG
ncbi:MAG: acyl-CoA thioesterase [Kofleriaceae bacterium]|nr:acyl-CoA thioesterase [Kofleriaceae bacterium]